MKLYINNELAYLFQEVIFKHEDQMEKAVLTMINEPTKSSCFPTGTVELLFSNGKRGQCHPDKINAEFRNDESVVKISKPRLVITVKGGIIQNIYTDLKEELDLQILDMDTEDPSEYEFCLEELEKTDNDESLKEIY